MADLFRESVVGQLLNFLSRGRFLPYDDAAADKLERALSYQSAVTEDATLSRWTTTRNTFLRAFNGEDQSPDRSGQTASDHEAVSLSRTPTARTEPSPDKLEKGVKPTIVTWNGPEDPAVSCNLSSIPIFYSDFVS